MREIIVKSILNKHKKRDEWFLDDYSVNPYIGCGYNCIYCYTKGSKYGQVNTNTVLIKKNAVELLEKELARRAAKKEYGFIALSTSTEPYQWIERKTKLTRRILQKILKYKFPVHILTKSDLVTRDIDLLERINEEAILQEDLEELDKGVVVNYSFSTIDERLARKLEPGAPTPMKRLEALKETSKKGLFAGISIMPTLPYISDTIDSLEKIVSSAVEYGAQFVFAGSLTLHGENKLDSKQLFFNFLEKEYPHLIKYYNSIYKYRMQPSINYQRGLEAKIKNICRRYHIRYGINPKWKQ